MTTVRFSRPPNALRKARLDNLVLMPASALPFKQAYQVLANRLPDGGVLIVTPQRSNASSMALRATAGLLRAKSREVALVLLPLPVDMPVHLIR